jgi:hypothetical protein
MILKLIKQLPKYSYTRFFLENKKTTKEQRRKAIKLFLDNTRCNKNTFNTK